MRVRFRTSIATGLAAYMDGQTLTLPDPLPQPFLGWLRDGLIEALGPDPELAVESRLVEQAIARRQPRAGRRKRASSGAAVAVADDGP